ncbi:MAG: histidine kinase [Sedimenticola sp.]
MADSTETRQPGVKAGTSFLPNFCSIHVVFALVVTAELLAIVLTLVSIPSLENFTLELSLYSLYVQWIALLSAAMLCLLRRWLNRLSDGQAGLVAWLLVLLLTMCVAWLSRLLLPLTLEPAMDATVVLKNLGVSGIVTALVLRYFYIQHLWRKQVVAESHSRFQALQSRIRPHFLFNSMNTIAHLTRSNPKLAETVVEDLSELFRASLSSSDRKSTLGDELDLIRHYLRIEGERLGARLRVEWDLDDDLPLQAPLPTLVLQPLLENAIYHGIEPASEPGLIQICGRYRRQKVNLSISNTLPSAPSEHHREGNRMALENTRQRLEGFFSGDAGLTISKVDGNHQVRVVFPHPWKV